MDATGGAEAELVALTTGQSRLRRPACTRVNGPCRPSATYRSNGSCCGDPILNRITGVPFHNTSRLSFDGLKDDPGHIAANVTGYIKGFSDKAREIFLERFKFPEQ